MLQILDIHYPLTMEKKDDDVIVFLTIATTGLSQNGFVPEICQITLMNQAGRKLFSKCVLPERDFQRRASLFSGFTIEIIDGKRCLMHNSKEVKAYSLNKVIDDLITEISAIRAQVSGRIILAGYYNQKYDIPLLVSELKRCDVSTQKLINMDIVCADLYHLVCSNRATLMPKHGGDLKMTTVYNILCCDNQAHKHNAVEDANKLRAIYCNLSGKIEKHVFEASVFSLPTEDGVGAHAAVGSVQQLQPRGAAVKRQSVKGDHEEELAKKKPCRGVNGSNTN